jgi:hypothetical protein
LYLAVVSVSAFCVEVIVKVLVTVAIYSLFMWDVYFQVMLVEYWELGPLPTPSPTTTKKNFEHGTDYSVRPERDNLRVRHSDISHYIGRINYFFTYFYKSFFSTGVLFDWQMCGGLLASHSIAMLPCLYMYSIPESCY